jgi:hypothetical protein
MSCIYSTHYGHKKHANPHAQPLVRWFGMLRKQLSSKKEVEFDA